MKKLSEEEIMGVIGGYNRLAAETVWQAVKDYERGYKFLKLRFKNKEDFPSDSELYSKCEKSHSLTNSASNIIYNYLTARDFLKSNRLSLFTSIDGEKIISHVEELVDSGSTLKIQALKASKYFKKVDAEKEKLLEDEAS